jgi:copper chaperone CopZ
MAVTIAIEGMTCGGCVNAVRNALQRAGVPAYSVEVGRVRLEEEAGAIETAKSAIERAGFVVARVSPDSSG